MTVCQAADTIKQHNKQKMLKLTKHAKKIASELKDSGKRGLADIKNIKKSSEQRFTKAKEDLKQSYVNMKWRRKRPDMTLLIEITLVIALAVVLYYVWPYLTSAVKPGFSHAQFMKATKMPHTAFNVEEMAKVNLEVKSLTDYANFFKSNPYSSANTGVRDLLVTAAVLPFIAFFIQFVLPPFVIAYVIWFIVRFWPYVSRALWAWFLEMYDYFTSMIQGKLGCKWYIRMVTGWGCNRPNFYTYFNRWRRNYVDRPIYYEKMKYVQKYQWAKDEYYVKPYRKYITLPYRRYKVKAQYAKALYIDRAIEVFLKKLRDMYPQYYSMPRDEFYRWLLGNNKNLAATYAKAMQAKAQIEGRSYRSVTEQGDQCTCPGTKTPVKHIKKQLKKQASEAKGDVDSLIEITNKVYDKANQVHQTISDAASCETVDKAVKHRRGIAGTVLIILIVISLLLYGYSSMFGTPAIVKNMISPTTQYITAGASLVVTGKSWWSLPFIYLSAITAVLIAVRFS